MKTSVKIMFLAALAVSLASCSNENNKIPEAAQEQGITFTFAEQYYESDQELTRTASRPVTVDLGDCEAEVLLEKDYATSNAAAQTRAITNRHYTIRAYRNNVKIGEISGTFNGSTFTADATSPTDLPLEFGLSYVLVAFNDDVTPVGDNLTVPIDKAGTAFIGRTTVTVNHPKKLQVAFTMNHVGARIRTQFVCQKDIPSNITSTIEGTAANTLPVSVSYNFTTQTYTPTAGSITPKVNNSPASTQAKYTASNGGQNFSYTSTGGYHYFLPTTSVSDLKLNLSSGTVFWNPLTGTIPKLSNTMVMQPGKSYLVKIKLKPKFTYLFSDGTTGYYSQTTFGGSPAATAKTPIAIVLGQGRAIALRPAVVSTIWCKNYKQFLTTMFADFTTCINDMKGYEYTWENTYSIDGSSIYANTAQTAFNTAANYNPGVVSTPWLQQPAHRWYLPAYGELKMIYYALGFGDQSLIVDSPSTPYYWGLTIPWYGELARQAFTQVNGNFVLNTRYHLSSSETDTQHFAEIKFNTTDTYWTGAGVKPYGVYVDIPFIKY